MLTVKKSELVIKSNKKFTYYYNL